MAIHLSKKAKIIIGVGLVIKVGILAYIIYKKKESNKAAAALQSVTLTPVQPKTLTVN